MINNKIVLTAEHYLFGDVSLPKGFHKQLSDYMAETFEQTHCVVLYKRLESFQDFLSKFPELPDIGQREFVVMRNGALKFSPDYLCRPLEEISLVHFISDEVVKCATENLFGKPIITLEFHKEFKTFIYTHFSVFNKIILCNTNKVFTDFLARFGYLPKIGSKKIVLHTSGKIFFTANYGFFPLKEISINSED